MSKVVLKNVINLENQTTAVNTINANSATIAAAFDNTLSRAGTVPNTMSAALDMNSHQINNLSAPLNDNNAARLIDLTHATGAALSGNLTFPGTGGQTRSYLTSLLDYPSVSDWSTGTNAYNQVSSAGPSTIFVPAGVHPTLPASYAGIVWDYLGGTETINFFSDADNSVVQRLYRSQPVAGNHIGSNWAVLGIEHRPAGSGGAGDSGDNGLMISVKKQNWGNSALTGQIAGIYTRIMNDGPSTGASNDGAAYLFDVIGVDGSGYYSAVEGNVIVYNTDRATVKSSIFAQLLPCNGRISDASGFVLGVSSGTMSNAITLQATSGGTSITNLLNYENTTGTRFLITGQAHVVMYPEDGTTLDFLIFRNAVGDFQILDSGSVNCFQVNKTTGNITSPGTLTLGASQVLKSRITGWNAPSTGGGGLSRGTFDTGATLLTTAETLAALITDLRTHGLIGT